MYISDPEAKQNLIKRLRRIEGQVRGVQVMLEKERDCREIMQQLAAIHSAIQGASRVFLQEYATACLSDMDDAQSMDKASLRAKQQRIIQDMISLLEKTP